MTGSMRGTGAFLEVTRQLESSIRGLRFALTAKICWSGALKTDIILHSSTMSFSHCQREIVMKIVTEPQQPTVAQQNIDSRGGKPEVVVPLPKRAKGMEKKDAVELSAASLETELKTREAEQARRVQALKELIQSGKYRVSSREVAEKMLSGSRN